MAHLPEDVVYLIFKHLALPSAQNSRQLWPFCHPALLSTSSRDSDAARNLRSCALVCTVWSRVASDYNIRVLDVARPTRATLTAALGTNRRCLLVRELSLGDFRGCDECRHRCTDSPPCTNGVQASVLLEVLAQCNTLQQLNVLEWNGDFEAFFSAPPTTPQFESITRFRLGYARDPRKMLPFREFCYMLRMLPGLKELAFGDIANTACDIADIPPPAFSLETLAVSDARGIKFRSYPWLLHNSGETLHTLWIYGVFGDSVPSVIEGLTPVARSLRSFHFFSSGSISRNYLGAFQDAVLNCSDLQQVTLGEIRSDHGYGELLLPYSGHPRLQSIGLALASWTAREDGTASVPRFYAAADLEDIATIISQSKTAYPKLRCLSIETYPSHPVHNPPVEALCQLRDVCQKSGVAFRFDRMCEIEP